MSTPPIDELMRLWRKGEITAEQAVGYMMQHLVALSQWRPEVEKPGALWARQLEQPPSKPQP